MDKLYKIENLDNGIGILDKITRKMYSPKISIYDEVKIIEKIKRYDFSANMNEGEFKIIISDGEKTYELECKEVFPGIEKNPLELNDIELRKMILSLCNKVDNLSRELTKKEIEIDELRKTISILEYDVYDKIHQMENSF